MMAEEIKELEDAEVADDASAFAQRKFKEWFDRKNTGMDDEVVREYFECFGDGWKAAIEWFTNEIMDAEVSICKLLKP